MKPDQSRGMKIVQAALGIFAVPALWPLAFVGTAIYLPDTIDPLLGGLQDHLYLPGLIWLMVVLLTTWGTASLFRLKRTNLLFLTTAIGCVLVLSAGLSAFVTWGWYQYAIKSGAPNDFDVREEVSRFLTIVSFSTAVSFTTALVFVCLGGFRLWKSRADV